MRRRREDVEDWRPAGSRSNLRRAMPGGARQEWPAQGDRLAISTGASTLPDFNARGRFTVHHHGPSKRRKIHEWVRRPAVEEFQRLLTA
jgi:hypothetical protein